MRNSTTLANRHWQMQVEFLLSSVRDDMMEILMLDISMGTGYGSKYQECECSSETDEPISKPTPPHVMAWNTLRHKHTQLQPIPNPTRTNPGLNLPKV